MLSSCFNSELYHQLNTIEVVEEVINLVLFHSYTIMA